jgi:serine/threonine protein kinase
MEQGKGLALSGIKRLSANLKIFPTVIEKQHKILTTVNAERWKQIDELFDAALEVTAERRVPFLAEKCNGDEDLKREVLSLLAAQNEAGKFLENSAMNLMAREIATENRAEFFSLVGRELGNYKIEKPIGAGGMGEVYLACDSRLNRKVALKILPAEFLADRERVKRFEREARAISALNHPYIVTVYDVGRAENVNYIATEYVEGETVRDLINGGADLKQALSVISQTCEALAAAHAAGIVHRDIKPENIMIRPDGYVKVLDFGLAKLTDVDGFQQSLTNFTLKGVVIGTPAYMSPEQVGDDKVDHRTDLWSVGVVLYEMLTGKNPFKRETRQATFQAILSENPPLVSEVKPNLPKELDGIVEKALEKDPDVSYQTASDLRADLKRVRREIDSSSSLRSGSAIQNRKTAKSGKRKYFLPFALLLLPLLVFGIWFFVFRQKQPIAIDWAKAQNVQLTERQGTEFFPSLAPDGKSFVYASEASGNFDIYVQRVGSKKDENLTADSTADDTMPAFSPDGESIAFRSEREPSGIYVMRATGENLRRVADFGFHPSWSPDGKEIVVSTFGRDQPTVHPDGEQALWIVNVEAGAQRELLKGKASFPSWSPSGKRIAYWFYGGNFGRRDIATVSVSGGDPVIITNDFAVSNWNPVWSPDGNFLYFVSSKGGNQNFWRVRIDETSGAVLSEPEPVVTPSKYSRHLNFSRDGNRLIYVQTDNQSNIQGAQFDEKTEKFIAEPFWITQGDREIARAELSPDGTRFVMRLIRRTQDDIVTVSRDGREWRDVTNDAPFDRYVRWSPDGKQFAFGSDRQQEGGNIWMSNADGTNLRQITFPDARHSNYGFPLWSQDGKRLCINGNSKLYLLDLSKSWREQTPQLIELGENINGFVAWDWSPDGKKLAGTIHQGKARFLGFYSFETNRYEKLLENAEVVASWLPDSRRIVYGKDNKIFLADTETKKITELFSSPNLQLRAPFVSRDGLLLYYTAYTAESDIWLLDNTKNP